MKIKLFSTIVLFTCILLIPFSAFSQSKEEEKIPNYLKKVFGENTNSNVKKEIINVIDRFMIAVNTKDKEIFNQILFKGINRIVTNIDKDNSVTTTVIDNDLSIKMRMNPKNKDKFRERYWDAKIITDGNIASVWAPYDFYLNGSFSHCGVDLFYLVKNNNIWKIAHFGYTRNKNCK